MRITKINCFSKKWIQVEKFSNFSFLNLISYYQSVIEPIGWVLQKQSLKQGFEFLWGNTLRK